MLGSFIGSIFIISICGSEIESILSAFGVASRISNSMLGLSVVVWGNSIGDLIANLALARRGFPAMGFAACFGKPMFSEFLADDAFGLSM